MIQSVLLNQAGLEQIAEFRLILTEITIAKSANKTKIALARSLKHSL